MLKNKQTKQTKKKQVVTKHHQGMNIGKELYRRQGHLDISCYDNTALQ